MRIASFWHFINVNFFGRLGFKVEKIERTFEAKRAGLIKIIQPDLVIDGGANIGQWALQVGSTNPGINIWSFEPLSESRITLEKNFSRRNLEWRIFPYALGRVNQKLKINVSSNSQMSSSILESDTHSKIHPQIFFELQRTVDVVALDSLKSEMEEFKSIYLKLDVQGYEMQALLGALKTLKKVSIIEVESSFTPLYVGETAHHELIAKIVSFGFTPFFVGVPHSEPSGRQYALDTVLVRDDLLHLLER